MDSKTLRVHFLVNYMDYPLVKGIFFSTASVSRYTTYKLDDFAKIEKRSFFCKMFFNSKQYISWRHAV